MVLDVAIPLFFNEFLIVILALVPVIIIEFLFVRAGLKNHLENNLLFKILWAVMAGNILTTFFGYGLQSLAKFYFFEHMLREEEPILRGLFGALITKESYLTGAVFVQLLSSVMIAFMISVVVENWIIRAFLKERPVKTFKIVFVANAVSYTLLVIMMMLMIL